MELQINNLILTTMQRMNLNTLFTGYRDEMNTKYSKQLELSVNRLKTLYNIKLDVRQQQSINKNQSIINNLNNKQNGN